MVDLYGSIVAGIDGRIAVDRDSADILVDLSRQVETWIEIGTLWGGSAILVALANPNLRVYAIDPLGGYYGKSDPYADNKTPHAGAVLDNFLRFGVAHQISLIKAKSSPWPLPEHLQVDATFIDGDHSPDALFVDIANSTRLAGSRFVLIHDYDDPPIKKLVEEAVDWNVYAKSERMIAFDLKGILE